MNELHGIYKDKETLYKIIDTLEKVGFEKLSILSNRGSHTHTQCKIKRTEGVITIVTEAGETFISMTNIRYIRLSYRNAVCIFETYKIENREYRAENWFLMNADQYRKFCRELNLELPV